MDSRSEWVWVELLKCELSTLYQGLYYTENIDIIVYTMQKLISKIDFNNWLLDDNRKMTLADQVNIKKVREAYRLWATALRK